MSDAKSNRGSPDRNRIDIHDPNELRYWTKALNVSEEKLKDTVGQSGRAFGFGYLDIRAATIRRLPTRGTRRQEGPAIEQSPSASMMQRC